MIAGDTQLSLITAGGLRGYPDYMRRVYASFTEITRHAQGCENAELDQLAHEQLITLDEDERMQIVALMQENVAADPAAAPALLPHTEPGVQRRCLRRLVLHRGRLRREHPDHAFITGREDGTEIRPVG
ncbi:MAG: hypothetical protein ACRDWI_14540 [Jiangellaceae bacterium]